jgi:prephenate dehydrogenase
MTINIAVIGLRQIGVSAALALAKKNDRIQFIGWDPDVDTWPAAKRQKIFRAITKNMRSAIKDARLVILSLLPDDLRNNAEELGKLITQDMIVVNITNLQDLSAKWIQEYQLDHMHYVSLLPTLNPALVLSNDFDLVEPHADLFKEGLIYILDSLSAEKSALDLAVDVCVLLGGKPILADPIEMDGLICANLLLPQLAAAVVMSAVTEQPSWREGQRIAGRALASSTSPLQDAVDAGDLSQTIYHQREHLVRLVNDLIKRLINYRELISDGDSDALEEKMRAVVNLRTEWIAERSSPLPSREFATSIPDEKQALKQFLKLNNM